MEGPRLGGRPRKTSNEVNNTHKKTELVSDCFFHDAGSPRSSWIKAIKWVAVAAAAVVVMPLLPAHQRIFDTVHTYQAYNECFSIADNEPALVLIFNGNSFELLLIDGWCMCVAGNSE